MVSDRRREERLRFCMEECRGSFILESMGEEYEIDAVTDLSLSGMGFEMMAYVEPETEVRLIYDEYDRRIALRGRLIWCEDHPVVHGGYRYGMVFDYASRDENSQLLLVLQGHFSLDRNGGMGEEG